jgi:hypothetical protein
MAPKKPTKQTRLQAKASQSNKVLTGPKGSKPQSTTNKQLVRQGDKTTTTGPKRGGGVISRPSKPAAAPKAAPAGPSKPDGRQPRAITNGNSPAMRQIRAKAVQKGRMAQGKSTVASRTQGSSPAATSRIRQVAQKMKPLADGPKVRQAQAQGQRAVAQAQARRGARQAMSRMEGTLRTARTLRNVASAAKTLARGGVAAAVMAPRPTAPGTLTAAKQAGLLKMRRKPTSQEASAMKAQESRLRAKNAQRKGSSFDDAFRDARRAKAKTFTWRGKKYTTEMK